ncbi:MAG: alcohol dehydrogenase catalytic domain-containing protein [Sporichthyaceae bacterium]|nr:alcohol dehydrogenase catalytic domain-containing protein [Sporichthyaceae bacterium]
MRAVLLDAYGQIEDEPLLVTERDDPEPGTGQVLVKVAACGVCRSNLHMVEGHWAGVPSIFPIIPGHEVVGTVEALGEGVTGFDVGDRVGVQPIWSTCGRCEYCLSGREQLCQSKEITGETVDGGYAEYMLATAGHTHPLPDELDFADAAPLFCPGITAYGSVAKASLSPTKSVAVFGVGGVGHVVLQLAALYGGDVIAVSRGAAHLELARELGASRTVDASREDPGETLAKSGGVDAAIVFAPSDAVVAQAVQATKPGGIIILGVHATIGQVQFAEEKVVVGSILGSRQQMREVLQLAAASKLRAVCEPYPLAEANQALMRLKRGEIKARAVLVT